jgi:hypothetical protein
MKELWKQFRLFLAETLLALAMEAAPKDTREGKEIVVMVAAYCKKTIRNIRQL